jgi:hypothetical protein
VRLTLVQVRVSQTAVLDVFFFFVSGSYRDTRMTQATPLLSRSPTANQGQKCTESHKRREREMCKASIFSLQHECRSVAKRVASVGARAGWKPQKSVKKAIFVLFCPKKISPHNKHRCRRVWLFYPWPYTSSSGHFTMLLHCLN